MMKKNKITQSEFARLIGLSRQGVGLALKEGLIPFELDGKKKVIDINNPDVKVYIKSQSRQREAVKKKPTTTTAKGTSPAKKTAAKKPVKKTASEEDLSELSPNELHKQIKITELKRKNLEYEIKQKKFLPTDFIQDGLFTYIEKLNSTMERSASVFINEIGQQILAEQEVTPKHIDSFVTLVLQAIDDTKKSILKQIKKYDPT